jgi:deazaflavin-dependent oxidoreductase (nitroreductase family)
VPTVPKKPQLAIKVEQLVERLKARLPIDKLQTRVRNVHTAVYLRSDGRLGASVRGMRFLLLTTTGRRSGRSRTTPLLYVRAGDAYLLVASNNGSDRSPDWLENLRREPVAHLQIGAAHLEAKAEIVERSDPRYERLIRLANEGSSWRYFHYQQKTRRPIPIALVSAT